MVVGFLVCISLMMFEVFCMLRFFVCRVMVRVDLLVRVFRLCLLLGGLVDLVLVGICMWFMLFVDFWVLCCSCLLVMILVLIFVDIFMKIRLFICG